MGQHGEGENLFYEPMDDIDRPGFIRKVFGILSIQLIFTALFAGICMHLRMSGYHDFVLFMENPIMLYMVFFGEIFSICALTCTGLDRKFPHNYALLAMFTFCISWIVGIVCMHVRNPVIVFEAVGLTAAMVVGLTFYAITTKHDFTMCGGVCWVLLLVLSIASLMCFMMGPAM